MVSPTGDHDRRTGSGGATERDWNAMKTQIDVWSNL